MASLQTLALYLAAGIEVEHKLHGRGLLHGLPSCHVGDEGQLASVRFVRPGSAFPDWYLLKEVKPVLYAPEDKDELLKPKILDGISWTTYQLTVKKLEQMAAIVDHARALGIALNLPPTDYIRKELR